MNRERSALADLDDLLISDHQTDGRPVLPEGSRGRVEEKLARLIVTHDLLVGHIRALRQRAGPPLRHAELLPDALHEAVVLGSPSVLDDAWLARLALNPVALCALRDDLFELPDDLPDAWWALLEREGRDVPIDWDTVPATQEVLRRAGIPDASESELLAATLGGAAPVPAPPAPVTGRWRVAVALREAEWLGREDAEESRRLENQEVDVEFSLQDRADALHLEVRLRGALRLGYSAVRCIGRLIDPHGGHAAIESEPADRVIRFEIPKDADLARFAFECDYHWAGSYRLLFRTPLSISRRS